MTCDGLTESEGSSAPVEIEEEFGHRSWHSNASCTWDGKALRLTIENDFDSNGAASLDEFGDAVNACVNYSGEIAFTINSVTEFAP